MISGLWVMLVGVPAVALSLVLFTVSVSSTPSTLGGEETPTVAATTPTTSAGTPTTAATTSTPAAGGTAVAGTPTTAAGLPPTGIADDSANASNASLLWLLGLAIVTVAVGGVLLMTSKRQ